MWTGFRYYVRATKRLFWYWNSFVFRRFLIWARWFRSREKNDFKMAWEKFRRLTTLWSLFKYSAWEYHNIISLIWNKIETCRFKVLDRVFFEDKSVICLGFHQIAMSSRHRHSEKSFLTPFTPYYYQLEHIRTG